MCNNVGYCSLTQLQLQQRKPTDTVRMTEIEFLYFQFKTSVVAVIAADIATAVDSFHRITTATAVAIDVFDGRCSVGMPLTISAAAAACDMVNSECL